MKTRPGARLLACLLAAAAGILVAAGCRGQKVGGGAAARQLQLAVIPMGTTHEFWKAIHAGAQTAGNELGVKIIWKGPLKEDDRNEQVQIVETMISAGVDGIVLTPMDDRALVPPVAEAKRAGIPTVIFNSALDGSDYVSYVSTDNRRGGGWLRNTSARCSGAAETLS